MQKKIGAIFLIAGTCIGSGVIALPLVLARLGIVPSIILMISIWFLCYYTAIVNLELNLQAKHGLSLGALSRLFSGKKAEMLGTLSLKVLSYSLIAVYIYGGSSIFQKLFGCSFDIKIVMTFYALGVICILLFPIHILDYVNRLFFVLLMVIFFVFIAGLLTKIDFKYLPLIEPLNSGISLAIPVVFTSFGFQVIFHTLTNYCQKDKKILKQAFFWGSLIPALVYILWSCGVLSVIFSHDLTFYESMKAGKVEVGDLVAKLSFISHLPFVQMLVWIISSLAIVTSVLGVSVGLVDSIKHMIEKKIMIGHHFLAVLITVLPPYLLAVFVPNAFISILGFAGMILVVIAILLPIYLLQKRNFKNFFYPELKWSWSLALAAFLGIVIIGCECFNMFMK